MNTKTELNRRNFLRGAGVALALPWMESLQAAVQKAAAAPPKRFLAVYVGHGFAITLTDDHPAREWSWYPRVVDGKMKFGKSMAGFNEFTDQTTVLYGLEHPRVIRSNGHGTADSFLTGSNIGDAVHCDARSNFHEERGLLFNRKIPTGHGRKKRRHLRL